MFGRFRRSSPASPRVSALDVLRATPEALTAAFAAPPEQAAPWLEAAAKLGMTRAQVLWGQILLDGLGDVPRDRPAAILWFRKAAESGDAEGMNMLGRCYEMGWGMPADQGQAAGWFRRAAQAGLDWAQYNLGNMYLVGRGVPQDRAEALRWYRRAAEQGHAKSLNMVARFLEEGWEGPPDLQEAARLYRLSAERGDFRGQFNLGAGLAATGRVQEAAIWFRKAAEGAHDAFRRSMAERLAKRPEPELRAIAADIAARLQG